jgi:hypothetical protein
LLGKNLKDAQGLIMETCPLRCSLRVGDCLDYRQAVDAMGQRFPVAWVWLQWEFFDLIFQGLGRVEETPGRLC